MKVVHIITRLLHGGAEENTIASCLDQVRRGYEVTLIHGCDHEPRVAQDAARHVTVIHIKDLVRRIDPVRDLRAFWNVLAVLRRIGPDVVHTHESKAGVVGRLAARAARVRAVVHTVHIAPFLNVNRPTQLLYVAAERAVAPMTDAIIDVSEGMRQACLDRRIGRAEAHRVIRSGMDIAAFRGTRVPGNWRARIGGWTGERPRIILMAAAFEPRKRQREFISALAPLLRDRTDICVVFAGEGPLLETCRALAVDLGLSQLRFVGHDPRLDELVALADVCVLTSAREGMPRVVIQYVAGGRPVVVTHVAGIEEVVADDQNGFIARGERVVATAAAASIRLCDDHVLRARLSAGARATDVSAWEVDRMGEAIAAVYAERWADEARRH